MEEEDWERTPWGFEGTVLSEPERERVSVVVRVVARRRVGERRVVMVRIASVRIWSREGDSSVGAEFMRCNVSGRDLEGVLGDVTFIDGMLSLDEEGDICTDVGVSSGVSSRKKPIWRGIPFEIVSEFTCEAGSGAEKDLLVVSGGRAGDCDCEPVDGLANLSPRPTNMPAHFLKDRLLELLGRVVTSTFFTAGISTADIGVTGLSGTKTRSSTSSTSTSTSAFPGADAKCSSFMASASISCTAFSSSTSSLGISEWAASCGCAVDVIHSSKMRFRSLGSLAATPCEEVDRLMCVGECVFLAAWGGGSCWTERILAGRRFDCQVSRWWRCGEVVSVGGDEPSSELGERGCEDGGTGSGSRHVAREGDMFDSGEGSDMAVDIHWHC